MLSVEQSDPAASDGSACSVPATICLAMDRTSPAQARRFVDHANCRQHHAERLDEIHLVVSELVTNGIRYGSPPLTLTVSCRGTSGFLIEVADGAPSVPQQRHPSEDEESGRGLALVDFISDAWGVDAADEGKRVWCLIGASG